MKRMVMFVYNDLNIDARVQRAAEALADYVNLEVVSIGKIYRTTKHKNKTISSGCKNNMVKYFIIIYKLLKYLKNIDVDIFYGHDFYSAFPIFVIQLLMPNCKIIYDAHELYLPMKGKPLGVRGYFFYFWERNIVKRVSTVIAAQEDRAKIMKRFYKLNRTPVVVRNVSKLPTELKCLSPDIEEVCRNFFEKPGYTIGYAGVISLERGLENLIHAVAALSGTHKVFIVGNGVDSNLIRERARSYQKIQILQIDALPYELLSLVLKRCDMGFVYYPTDTLNNKYCASNKIYEYASIGLPVVSNNNPTIKSMLEEWSIGVAEDNLIEAIQKVTNNLKFYKSKTISFSQNNSWNKEKESMIRELEKILK